MFLTFALAALAGALSLFRQRNLVLAGLSLGLCFLGLAGLFLLLANPVAAALQVMVYAGAIVVLVLMVVMLMEAHEEEPAGASRPVHRWIAALLMAGFGTLAARLVFASHALRTLEIQGALAGAPVPVSLGSAGARCFQDFLVPFEVAGLLLLAALVGTVALLKREL